MNITFYNYVGDNRKVHKNVESGDVQKFTITGTLRDEGEFIAPSFTTVTDPTGYNYVYIPAFERYYFIRRITVVRSGLWLVECYVDVLKTYEDYIDELMIYADYTSKRPENDNDAGFNKLMPNPYDKFLQPTIEKHIRIPSGFDFGDFDQYILVTVG